MNSKIRKWKFSPLPFQGQKRFFVNKFEEALKQCPEDATYVDLFGGSGLLGHTVKRIYPRAKVIYNDYDGFSKRLKEIPNTNAILEELREIVISTPRANRIIGKEREAVLKLLKQKDSEGFVDWVTLSGSLMFSGKYGNSYEEFEKATFYNTIRKSNFDTAEDYLDGLELMSEDYKSVFNSYNSEVTIFLVDPPYLSTDTSTYRSEGYWKLKDYLDVVNVLDGSYFYFTSEKSQIVPLMEWVETKVPGASPFSNATCTEVINGVNYNSNYRDLMYYRINHNETKK